MPAPTSRRASRWSPPPRRRPSLPRPTSSPETPFPPATRSAVRGPGPGGRRPGVGPGGEQPEPPRQRLARLFRAGALDRPRPLPDAVRPLARLLAPGRGVTYTSGSRTGRALAATGAAAAATGTVVHLPRPPRAEPHDLGLLAHELAHVGDRGTASQGAELLGLGPALDAGERRARRVGDAVATSARSAAGLPAGTAGLPVGGSPATRERVLAAARDAASVAVRATPAATPATAPPTRQPAAAATPSPVAPAAASSEATGGATLLLPTASVARDLESQLGELLEALEERVLLELERRGGRWGGEF